MELRSQETADRPDLLRFGVAWIAGRPVVTVDESAGESSGLLQVAEVTIHLTLEAPSSEVQSDLLYLDLTAGANRSMPMPRRCS